MMSFTELICDSENESENDDSPEYCEDDFDHSDDLKINESYNALLAPPAPLTCNIKLFKNFVIILLVINLFLNS